MTIRAYAPTWCETKVNTGVHQEEIRRQFPPAKPIFTNGRSWMQAPRGKRRWERRVGTNKCLVRQLLCLYPFPHCSQRSSGRLLFLPSLSSGWPSLALRTRVLSPPSSPDMSLSSSSMALSWVPVGMFIETNLFMGKLPGGEGRLPAIPDRDILFLDTVLRREPTAIGSGVGRSPASCWRAAAMAATLAPVLVMLFRRVTRWLPLSAAPMTEWEVLREWDWRVMDRPPDKELDIDGRWVRGLEVC